MVSGKNSRQEFAAEKGVGRGRKSVLGSEVKRLLEKGLSVEEVAKTLNKPSRTIRYHAQKLRGIVAAELLPGSVPIKNFGNISLPIYYRVHDFTLSFPIRFVSDSYRRRLKKGNVAIVREHRVQLFSNRLVIRAAKGFDVRGNSESGAFDSAMVYWENIVRVLEGRWKVSLWKRDGQFSVTCEVAEVGNELARDMGRRREWVRIIDPESGKGWVLVDASTGVPEIETVDRLDSRDDMARAITPLFNDLRRYKGELPVLSDIVREQSELRSELRELVAVVRAVAELQKAQVVSVPVTSSVAVADSVPWYIE